MIDFSPLLPKFIRRELLFSPQIPAPMGGVNPRTVLGQSWWDVHRKAAYAENRQHCWACGVHAVSAAFRSHLEGHESYDIDYSRGRMRLREVVALCHSCHNFIHIGRLKNLLQNGLCGLDYAQAIVNHGYSVLAAAGLKPWWTTRLLIEPGYSPPLDSPGLLVCAEWSEWRMVISGREYPPKFPNREAHDAHYARR